ncbi:anaphase promoting complex subunit 5 [Podila minutissima]|uniref:Anaphase-promoting complex subunit 5 n=1 Tax=Podila minutissima TaxID=64525 RepID=A0A9P5VJ88_9FUNG|nr:anaphase promoting complex subunit 5 [Podila minutissima]
MAYLTPHKISILILIEYFCQHQSPPNDVQKLSQFLLKCIQDPSEYLQNDLKRFGEQVAREAGQPAWDHLQETLMRIKSSHHLSDFLVSKLQKEDCENLSTIRPVGLAGLIIPSSEAMTTNIQGGLDPTSILGLYIRKAQIEFRKLLFEDTCQLFCAIETYKASLYKRDDFPDQDGLVIQSVYDAEKYLDLQTQHLSNPSLQDIPNEVLEHVKSVQLRMPTVAKSHYIMQESILRRCLQAQQTGNFEMAVQSLHQFFDYCMSMHDQALYQYALLNLAILHARFGHFDQARFAIRETVEVARDNMDQECLSYALSWHDRLTGTSATSSAEMNEAGNLAGQIEGQSFHYLQSLGELIKSRQLQSESTSETLEALVRSSSINLRHSLDGVGGVVQLFQSRTWEAYGNAPLSSLYSQMQHHFRPSESDMSDAASSLSKFASDLALNGQYQDALRVLEQAKSKFPLRTMRATPWVQTLLQILQKRALGSNRLRDAEIWTAQLGATLVTPTIQPSNLKKRPIEVVEQEKEAEIEVATKRGPKGKVAPKKEQELKKKEQADEAEKIRSTQMDDTTLEIQLDIILQSSLLSVLAGQRLSGIEQLSEGLELVRQNQWPGTQKFTVVYLLALAELYLESDSAISALPLLLVAIMLSEDNFQRPLQFVVKLRMADVLLHLDSVQQASDLVDGVMAMVLNQGDMFVQALAYFQNAKCLLARANQFTQRSKGSPPEPQRELTKRNSLFQVYELLRHALQGFQVVESLKDIAQVLYFMVRVFHELDLAEDLKAALADYKNVSKRLLEGTMNQEPSWYSYYYTHDAFDSLLRSETESQAQMDIDR